MTDYEVPEPILNSPFLEPAKHWRIARGEEPVVKPGRRPSNYFYVPPGRADDQGQRGPATEIELKLVNLVRRRVGEWRDNPREPYPGVSGTTRTLLQYWRREGRQHPLFFAQLEAAETVVFLTEARADLLQGIEIPPDEPGPESQTAGARGFRRLACKMATGSGKTTVMGMLAAWSILNKVADRSSARFSDTVLVVCPNVTIRRRLAELDTKAMEASLYRTRDLVPPHLMPDLAKGRVVVTNWHIFEPQVMGVAGVSARVVRAGRREVRQERIRIGTKTTSGRGGRTMTLDDFNRQDAADLFTVIGRDLDDDGNLESVIIEAERFVESDTAVVERVLREVRGKQNILVMNDEAHHAYRIRRAEPDPTEADLFGEEDEKEQFYTEATVWIEGLDRIQKLRGINFCLDFSATPYFLGRVGQETNRPFPWVVSDFSLTDAIESGLVKVPQLAVRDTTGAEIPGYFNLWRWIAERLTPAERGGSKGSAKPEAILKWANTPIAMLGGLWQDELRQRAEKGDDPRPPVFILVCRNTRIAKVVYDWLAEDKPPFGVPPAGLHAFRNNGKLNTLRVDTRVVEETDTGQAKSDEDAWMRFTLDTVGKLDWPRDALGRPLYPDGFEDLARKLGRPLHPPGRDVRCIVSVGMLTEGWDCNTVTHIIGLRPFTSQLLCEQVVGRGLRRFSYDVKPDGMMNEEVALILGVPFEVVPFKASTGQPVETPERHHVHAIPSRAPFEIKFPRVEGYRQAIRNRIDVDWQSVPTLVVDPMAIPPEVQLKATLPANQGRPTLMGPGRIVDVSLSPCRAGRRRQKLVFDLARDLTREYASQASCEAPPHVLFPQLAAIVERFLKEKLEVKPPANLLDAFLAPYYGWIVEIVTSAIRPDTARGEAPELPRYESNRGPGSTAEVDFWTTREVREVLKSHVNYVVADTAKWEQSAAYLLDRDARVQALVKNAGLGFAIPYLHNGQPHDYVPDFIVRLGSKPAVHLILETKGHDPLKEIKMQVAERWVAAVNADGRHGLWAYELCSDPSQVPAALDRALRTLDRLAAAR